MEAPIQVLAPLQFAASYPMDKLALRIKESVDLYGGRIRLGKMAGAAWLGIRGDGALLSLKSTLGVDVKQPLMIPCGRIGLSDGTPYTTPQIASPASDRTIGTGVEFIPLYRSPREVDPLHIQFAGPFKLLRKRPGWVMIEAAWSDGSRVRGWTLERFATTEVAAVGGWGEGQSGDGACGLSDPPPLVKILLRKQAAIAVSAGGPVWARVARQLSVDAFPAERADGWIQVAAVPGLPAKPCSEHEHIWVQSRDVIGSGARTRP